MRLRGDRGEPFPELMGHKVCTNAVALILYGLSRRSEVECYPQNEDDELCFLR